MANDEATLGTARGRWWGGVVFAVAAIAFVLARRHLEAYVALHRWLDSHGVPAELRNLDHWLWLALGAVAAARWTWGRGGVRRGLGLDGDVGVALRFAALATAPMLVQAVASGQAPRFQLGLVAAVVLAPVIEELLFRAVLVGIPTRRGGVPFWPCAVAAGLLFGAMHVPWTAAFSAGHVGVLAATTAGGIWYAWLLRVFAWNVWTTILLHAGMNAVWMVFGLAEDAAGGLWPNVGRGATIAVGTLLALRQLRRRAGANGDTNVVVGG